MSPDSPLPGRYPEGGDDGKGSVAVTHVLDAWMSPRRDEFRGPRGCFTITYDIILHIAGGDYGVQRATRRLLHHNRDRPARRGLQVADCAGGRRTKEAAKDN